MTLIRKERIMFSHFQVEVPYVFFSIINRGLIAAPSSILLWNLFKKNGTRNNSISLKHLGVVSVEMS